MLNVSKILNNASLEKHFIIYLGFRSLHRRAKRFFDPALYYEAELQELYYQHMLEGVCGDLREALWKEAKIDLRDPTYRAALMAVVDKVIERHGIHEIRRQAKEFLWEMESRSPDEMLMHASFFPSVDACRCPDCDRNRIFLDQEDVPHFVLIKERVFREPKDPLAKTAWYCVHCKEFSRE